MDSYSIASFASEALLQWFVNAPSENSEYAEVLLYTPDSLAEIYYASYSVEDEAFVLYDVLTWERDDHENTIIPTMVEELRQFDTPSELCDAIVEIANEKHLLPQLGFYMETDEDLS